MPGLELIRFDTDDALVKHAAERWIERVTECSIRGAPHACALSGGRIARQLLHAIAQSSPRLGQVHFFWADERCVPPAHVESNYRVANEALFLPCKVPMERIHRIEGERVPIEACALAERDLRKHVGDPADRVPVLDWVFLGMGEDGHIASLFPGAPDGVDDPRRAYVAVRGPKPPPDRVSLSYAALAAAREVYVLVSGPGKRDALEKSLSAPGGTPLSKLLQTRAATTVLVCS